MKLVRNAVALVALLAFSLGASADPQCDCSKIIGQCMASIKVTSVTGTKPSYTANFSIFSTSSNCSKVSYFIDSTPYFNVLAGTNQVSDSTFGSEPITIKNFSDVKCEVCASAQAGAGAAQPTQVPAVDPVEAKFVGSWAGKLKWLLVSDPITVVIESKDGRLGGRVTGKSGTSEFTSVVVSGNRLTYTFIGMDKGSYSYTMTLTGEGVARVESNGGLSFSGEVRRAP